MVMDIIFWTAVGLIAYAYIGYPLVVILVSLIMEADIKRSTLEPTVTLMITAYNEEKNIEEKINNSFQLDYPSDKLEIVVSSDGSTDATDEIVKRYEKNHPGIRVILHRVEGRLGKTAAQNSAIEICRGEIIVFSDAASMYDRNVIRAIVRNYADPSVGAVSGNVKYINKKASSVGFATTVFWSIENFIKCRQTKIKTITGCSGCLYSIRKNLYTALPPSIISDLVEPLTILRKGYRIIYEPEALAFEETAGKTKEEFKMRIRVIVRGMNGMLFVRELFNPVHYPYVAFQLISHKLMRWFVPIFCIVAFAANAALALASPFYLVLIVLQMVFYALAVIGHYLDKAGIHKRIFYLPLYFCVINLASLISMVKVLRQENIVTWQTQR